YWVRIAVTALVMRTIVECLEQVSDLAIVAQVFLAVTCIDVDSQHRDVSVEAHQITHGSRWRNSASFGRRQRPAIQALSWNLQVPVLRSLAGSSTRDIPYRLLDTLHPW